jgi:hypothetical protein
MPLKKRTNFERERDLERITEMYLRGKFQSEIAEVMEVSQGQISYDLTIIKKRWQESSLVNWDEARQRELARIDELERTYWSAWEASKTERTKARQEKNNAGATVKASMEKEQRDGNPAFLDGVMKCITERCKILGLNAPTKNQNFNVDLSSLTDEQLDRLDAGESMEQVLKRDRVAA